MIHTTMQVSHNYLKSIVKDYRNQHAPLPKKHSNRINENDYQRYLMHDRLRRSFFKKMRRIERVLKKIQLSDIKENEEQISNLTTFLNLLKIGHFDLKELLRLCDEEFKLVNSKHEPDSQAFSISLSSLKNELQSINKLVTEAIQSASKLDKKRLVEILK